MMAAPVDPPLRRSMAQALLEGVPPFVMPLALQTVNLGLMWSLAIESGLLASAGGAEAVARLGDVCAVAATLMLLLVPARAMVTGGSALWTDYTTANPPYAAGLMGTMGIAAWLHARGGSTGAVVVWTAALVVMLIGQLLFLRHVARASSKPLDDGRAGSSGLAQRFEKLWSMAAPPWILPLVGVSAAAATGGKLVRWATSADGGCSSCSAVALYGPVALGGSWACIIIVPLWAKAIRTRALVSSPPSAILMAPPALNLAGWLGAVGGDLALQSSWLTHLLAILVVALALPIGCLAPRYLDVRKPFSPAIATVGFPMEIGAISLVRYQATLNATGIDPAADASAPTAASGMAAARPFWQVAAWVQLVAATLAVSLILLRFAIAAGRAFCAEWWVCARLHHDEKMAAPLPVAERGAPHGPDRAKTTTDELV